MNFTELDFHISTRNGEEPLKISRPFRIRINYILDSFSLRIPKRTKTTQIRKLNVCVNLDRHQKVPFFVYEGIADVEFVEPEIGELYRLPQAEVAKRVKAFLKRGLRTAGKHDRPLAAKQKLWDELLATAEEEFDYELGLSRTNASRSRRCDAVLRITPKAYYYDVVVRNTKSLEVIHRHRVESMECLFPMFRGIGFAKFRWDGNDVIALSKKDQEVFRFTVEPGADKAADSAGRQPRKPTSSGSPSSKRRRPHSKKSK